MGKTVDFGFSPTGIHHSIEIDDGGFTSKEYTPTRIEKTILDANAENRKVIQSGGGLRHAARIPMLTHHQWKTEWREKHADRITWPTFLSAKLNSPENENLRTGYKRGGSMKL